MTRDERFWRKVDRSGECWIWQAAKDPHGYGRISRKIDGVKVYLAHRYAYLTIVGPIEEGLTLDHLCRNTSCVNPEHLEPVTLYENFKRGENPKIKAHLAGTCTKGHPLTPETRLTHGQCRQCNIDYCRARREALA